MTRKGWGAILATGVLVATGAVGIGCNNNPYPDADNHRKVLYTSFASPNRTLDPAEAYNVSAHRVTGLVYGTLLEYHFLKRPYTLIPGLAKAVPVAEPLPDGRVRYRFSLRKNVMFAPDPAFQLNGQGRDTREATMDDVAYQLMRLADPALEVQVRDPFSRIEGFREFSAALSARREEDRDFAAQPPRVQYAALGGMKGVQVNGPYALTVVLREPYPQILYWFAMEFTTPVAWEAVETYDGEEDREQFSDHPVGTGPYRIAVYDKRSRIVFEQNPNWYGLSDPSAPGAHYPREGSPGDTENGLLDPDTVGKPLPFIERIEMRFEKEGIPLFNKFLQGYYDAAGIIKESFDQVVQSDRLTPGMADRGIRLQKGLSPGIFYLGFNLEDDTIGTAGGERARKLRQAMSVAVDSEKWIELFLNGRGLPAQTPIPPAIAGAPPGYSNPYRQVDLDRARQLLAEAGYPGGVDQATGRPLRLTFDVYEVSSGSRPERQYFVDEWRKLGIDVELASTTYNEFQAKVNRGAYQIYFWGWSADYPDPENFLFLLTCDMRKSTNGGPNSANFCHERFDALFDRMETMENGPERDAVIREMIEILEEERPWIEIFNGVDYSLAHGWLTNVKPFGMSYPMTKYMDIDPEARQLKRQAWNEPIVWPVGALLLILVVGIIPAVRTFFQERQ